MNIVEQVVNTMQDRNSQILEDLRRVFGELAGQDLSEADPELSFFDLGFDSLLLTQASAALKKHFAIKVTFRELLQEFTSLGMLASHVASLCPPAPEPSPAPSPAVRETAAPVATQVEVPLVSTPTADRPALERLIHAQLQLMEQQLDLLRGRASHAVVPPPPSLEAAAPNAGSDPAPAQHGPFRPVRREAPEGALTEIQRTHLNWLTERYVPRTRNSKEYARNHRPHFADPRAVAGFNPLWKELVYPIVATRSEGAYLWDLDGNRWVDVTMGFGVAMLGHSPAFVGEAVRKQLELGVEIGPQSPLAGDVARMICEFTGMDRATFCNTGSEAVMAAIRLCRTVTGRNRIALFAGAYHGTFDEVLVKGSWRDGQPRTLPLAPGVAPNLIGEVTVLEYGSERSLEWIRAHAEELAAVLVEPVQSRHPGLQPAGFLREVRQITKEAGAALIIDEVITGFRCHPGGAQAYFGVQADLATYGKVIGGGMPLGVIAGRREFMDALDGGQWQYGDDSFPEIGVTFFAGTFVRHPLAMAAADVVLRYLKDQGPALQAGLADRTERMIDGLNAHFASVGAPLELERFTSVWYPRFGSDVKYGSLLYYHLREKGLHIWEGRPCFLSTAHTDEDIEFIVQAFKTSVAEMQAGAFLPRQGQPEESASSVKRHPASMAQREMWAGAQVHPESAGPHHACTVVRFDGPLDLSHLRDSITEVVERHEALRSTISADGCEMIVHPVGRVDVPLSDLSLLEPGERQSRIDDILQGEAARIFNLEDGSLFRFEILKLDREEHLLVFTVNMLVCDGWSHYVVFEDMSAIYSARVKGRSPALKPVVQMEEYVVWEQRYRETEEARQCTQHWLSRFENPPSPADLPTRKIRPPFRTYDGARCEIRIEAALYANVKQTALRRKNSVFALLLAAYQVWLTRLTGSRDFAVGIPIAGQAPLGMETLVGQCVRIIPYRVTLSKHDEPFADLLSRTQSELIDAQEHAPLSLGELTGKLSVPTDPGRMPLVPLMFNIDPPMSRVKFDGVQHIVLSGPRRYFQYDLGFNLVDEGESIRIECDFNPTLLEVEWVESWLASYLQLLEAAVSEPATPVSALPMANECGIAGIPHAPHDVIREAMTLHGMVSRQAASAPHRIAVQSNEFCLSYHDLEQRSNQLAHHLILHGVDSESLVAVCLDRTPDLVAGLLGILKAGGAYFPVSPDLPRDRKRELLEGLGVKVILTQASHLSTLPADDVQFVCLDEDRTMIAGQSAELPQPRACASDLAYVMQTSGSTGQPKFVEITNRSVVNFLSAMALQPGLDADDTVLAQTSLSFDIAVLEIFLPLIVGGRVFMAEPSILHDCNVLSETIANQGITVIQATPSGWHLLLNSGWRGAIHLKVLCGGEPLTRDLADKLAACCGEVWNLYGATEATAWATCCRVEVGDPISIGQPIPNVWLHIVDDDMNPAAIGVAGEVLIGGAGVARGYRNQPELSAESFRPDPIFKGEGHRVYRTGDLARRLPDGRVEFVSRGDNTIKVRGCRIDPSDVESRLLRHPGIREAAIAVWDEDTNRELCVAYVVADPDVTHDQRKFRRQIRESLRQILPTYMVPSGIMFLEALPRNPESSKLDRRRLPAPVPECFACQAEAEPPCDDLERRLLGIWKDALHGREFGVMDNFFDLGGQSLTAVALFAAIEREFGQRLPLALLFRSPTVRGLAREISGGGASSRWESLVPIQTEGSCPPLFLVHGAGGNILLYRALARQLAPEYPLYGLQARGLDGASSLSGSIEEMAEAYIREIRSVQREGPYFIGGYCMGGTVAYEMAQQLSRAGQDVGLVALLDTYNYAAAKSESGFAALLQRVRFHGGNLVRMKPSQVGSYFKEKIRIARDGEWLNAFGALGRKSASCEVGAGELPNVPVQANNDRVALAYCPSFFPGRVTLFNPQINYDCYPDPKMGWGDLVGGELEVVRLPVNPHAMLVDPFVAILAAELKSRIAKVREPISAVQRPWTAG